jgi:nucleotide-binding universal stress UspA family protein
MPDDADAPDDGAPRIRRILVALDASAPSRAALDAAARLAADLGAQLTGLFVADADVRRAARLPFVREVRGYGTPPRRLTEARVRRQQARQRERAERLLRRVAERMEVEHAFRTAEGRVAEALRTAAREADLVALGRTSGDRPARALGATARALLADAPAAPAVLLLRHALRPRQPLTVYYDATDAGERALRLAAALATGTANPLQVLLPTGDPEATRRRRDAVVDRLGARVPRLTVRALTRLEASRLADAARNAGAGLVIVPADAEALADDALHRFLATLDRPALVVR